MRFLSADAIFDGLDFLKEGSILVLNEKQGIEDILSKNSIGSERLEKYSGCLIPGFVNAHCHLELSHLKGKIEQRNGLPAFAKQLMSQRFLFPEGEILEHIQDANQSMLDLGTVAVGDICNTALSFKIKADSKIYYHSFIELIALDPRKAREVMQSGLTMFDTLRQHGLAGSLVPHAPYSVSEDLFKLIQTFCEENEAPCSIHNQESLQEIEFLTAKSPGFEALFAFLNIDLSFYKAPGTAGVSYLKNLLPQKSILVHNTFSNGQDIEQAKDLSNYWCFCPRANLFIENSLPDFKLFTNQKERVCLGTDSLASNINLDLIQEANLLLASGSFEINEVLSALSFIGAKALGLEQRFGRISKGYTPGINLIRTEAKVLHFQKKIC